MIVSENSVLNQCDGSTRRPDADDRQPSDVRDILLSITRETAGTKDLKTLLQTIADTALTVIPSAEKSVIHLLDATASRLVAHVCSTPWPVRSEQSGIPAHEGIAGQALSTKQVICVRDTNADGRYAPLGSGSDIRSLLVAPLLFRDLQLGTLSLSSAHTEAFRPIDVEYVAILAAQAAGAIHQTNLLREATSQRQRSDAIIDQMFDGLLIVSADGQVRRTNPALHQTLGLDAKAQEQVELAADDPHLSQLIDPLVLQPHFTGGWGQQSVQGAPLVPQAGNQFWKPHQVGAGRPRSAICGCSTRRDNRFVLRSGADTGERLCFPGDLPTGKADRHGPHLGHPQRDG